MIGLAPYSKDSDAYEKQNFMKQIQVNNLIDHNVISFYISNTYGNSSFVKFGSYDEKAIAPGSKLNVIRTNNLNSWEISSNEVKYSGVSYIAS